MIFTGGPASVYGENAPSVDPEIFNHDIPILGICYGAQLMAHHLGGKVARPQVREYGKKKLSIQGESCLLKGLAKDTTSWMSHTDYIERVPEGFEITGITDSCPVAVME